MGGMPEPLSSQLSRTLVSFTIEADDEFEHRVPHRTTRHGTTAGSAGDGKLPWLVSHLMWSMCMRFVPDDGVSVRSYAQSAWWLSRDGISTTLRRMGGWWGYLTLDSAEDAGADRIIRQTAGGRLARQAWEPLTGEIEQRWRSRFGPQQVDALCSALADLVGQFDRPLPDCLRLYDVDLTRRAPARPVVASTLPGLLSQAIVQLELEFEAEHRLPMSVCGNVLRVLGEGSMLVKNLPARTGLAKDGVEDGLRSLERRKLVTVGPGPDGRRLRTAALTPAGQASQRQAAELAASIEDRWRSRYGERRVAALTDALAPVAGDPDDPAGPLWRGLYRYPDGWRSSLPRPDTLPHHPAPSHRGGYLDGA
jgi:DNA-binding MarR family transcriptional regulator